MAGIPDYNKILKEETKAVQSQKNKDISAAKKKADDTSKSLNTLYSGKISDAEKDYNDQYRENSIQKLINERAVAENMANMGLTDSGLNRTQQTAVQLSYANQKGNIDRQKQSQADALARELTGLLADVEINKNSELAQIESDWDKQATQNAISRYNTQYEAYSKEQQLKQSAYEKELERQNKIILKQMELDAQAKTQIARLDYGTLASTAYDSNGNVIYTDFSGRKAVMRAGSNPFTGEINTDALNEYGEYDKTKVWNNGYQPNNYKGKKLTAVKGAYSVPATMDCFWRTDGIKQQVFTTGNDKFYVWVGPNNSYEEIEYNYKDKEWVFA